MRPSFPAPCATGTAKRAAGTRVGRLPAAARRVACSPGWADERAADVPVGRDLQPACVTVVEQLWADEPAQVWQAAGRLSAAGVPRQQVIRRLAAVWRRCDGADPAAYATALESVGR